MPKCRDLSLYLVLEPTLCGGIDGMLQTVAEAIEHGVTVVQLRSELPLDKKIWYQSALALKQLLQHTTVPLIINDQVDIALAVDADGVHIGQNDLPPAITRRLLGEDKWLGLSVSNPQQLAQVAWDVVDYLGIGPIFATTTKHNAAPAIGCDGLSSLLQATQKPVVAIGGIKQSNAAAVLQTGVDGIAVVSAICGQADVAAATRQLQQLIIQSQATTK